MAHPGGLASTQRAETGQAGRCSQGGYGLWLNWRGIVDEPRRVLQSSGAETPGQETLDASGRHSMGLRLFRCLVQVLPTVRTCTQVYSEPFVDSSSPVPSNCLSQRSVSTAGLELVQQKHTYRAGACIESRPRSTTLWLEGAVDRTGWRVAMMCPLSTNASRIGMGSREQDSKSCRVGVSKQVTVARSGRRVPCWSC